ncbi:RsmD family RNA methyltransferase [Robertkochia solimangrovi]|uniref:RsmD family RNA methyltransferase n=1 Tax=Robertkochia solimangrovi TaxID=2213046 RepID=UPI00117FF285|nr:RsmD family RNA methyltransferase [Robertkochia solimangrovi]TRZ42893.1 16S rRNA (guanine(966)-N(2))-methyltransferase RsmD [Robertkochia solimangrovi]
MRIISGKYKGKRLTAPSKLPVRPTTDFAKEALFNVLNNHYYFNELTVTDLFAGTGNISFEFASRGCEHLKAVDAHSGCVQYIRKISEELEFNIQCIKSDVFVYLEKATGESDIIFADPPYDMPAEKLMEMADLVFKNELLGEEGMLIIEHSKHVALETHPYFNNARKYGGSVFSFFEWPDEES